MNTRFPICYLILIYTLLAIFTRAADDPGGADQRFRITGGSGEAGAQSVAALEPPRKSPRTGDVMKAPPVRNATVPEPGAVGLVTTLVTLLALQRRRD